MGAVDEFAAAFAQMLNSHQSCTWEQVGPCVYCTDHDVRLYQGTLPEDRRPHCEAHDWDEEIGIGFYMQCRRCGVIEWFE